MKMFLSSHIISTSYKEYIYGQQYTYIQGSPVQILTCNTLETDWMQHDRHTACVIAQHQSSTTFIPLCFHSHKEEYSACISQTLTVLISPKLAYNDDSP